MKKVILLAVFLIDFIHLSVGVTIIHHDKPERANIQIMATTMNNNYNKEELNNVTLTHSERQKRLLPYINFYQTPPSKQAWNEKPYVVSKRIQTHYNEYRPTFDTFYHPKPKYTPFTEGNIVPGPFKPIVSESIPQRVKIQYVPTSQNKLPDFSEIYDKLSLLKLSQNRRPTYVQIKPQQTFLFKPQIYNKQKLIEPSKTTIQTYTSTNIDIPSENVYENFPLHKPYVNQQIAVEVPQSSTHIQQDYNRNPYQTVKKPFIIVSANPEEDTNKPIILPQYETITDQYEPFPKYQDPPKYESTPNQLEYNRPYKNPINLSSILKYLQATNALPKTITSDNIDNSIKTLVKILNALKKQQKLPKPEEETASDYNDELENEAGVDFPEDTEEGGTPGKPGVDYPALSSIPQTSFNCKTQRYKGFFGDPDTHCQVWHYCDLNGGQASFLCPNGTIFSQVALTCDWWYNVKCASTAQLYVLNERLYKYIIPLSPKFPEDYTGPLVDKYLALKFQEMEEKMKKEKKGSTVELDKVNESEDSEKFVRVDSSTNVSIQKETLETVENDNKN